MRHTTCLALLLPLLVGACASSSSREAGDRPNIIFIMADDLGYGHLGCYGGKKIDTRHVDAMAEEGMKFTQCYAGATVCAPSRSVLMTGLHGGHTPVRGNLGGQYLYPEDVTIAEVLRSAGYATGGFGKWGLGQEGSAGHPLEQGFDEFFGYLHQVHAHFFYPYWLVDDHGKFMLPENEGRKRGRYSHDAIMERAVRFIRRNRSRPFFCYLPVTIPHVEVVAPEASVKQYRGRWPETPGFQEKRPGYIVSREPKATYAAMVSHLDRDVGRVISLVRDLGLEDNTLVIFTSDNGAQSRYDVNEEFFNASGPLRGYKGSMWEGGLRAPMVARWPGRIAPGTTSHHIAHFADMMATFAELAGAKPPEKTDGISFLPTLLGKPQTRTHEFLQWELVRNDGSVFRRGARWKDWKLVQNSLRRPPELYNLKDDLGEASNVAKEHPDVVEEIQSRIASGRTPARAYERGRRPASGDYVR